MYTWISMASLFKKTQVELELLTNVDMLLSLKKELEVKYVMQYIGILKQTISI